MVQRSGMVEEKLGNTAYTWQALRALEAMAKSKGDEGDAGRARTASWADQKVGALEGRRTGVRDCR
jgi:hypothetical protein